MPADPPAPDLLELPAERAVRLLALRHLGEAAEARARVHADTDEEALHDFRVALRRLRSLVRTYARPLDDAVSRRQRRRLRKLAAATNEARDLEVQLAWLAAREPVLSDEGKRGVAALTAELRGRRAAAREAALRQVTDRFDRLRPKLQRRLARYRCAVRLDVPGAETPFAVTAAARVSALAAGLAGALAAVSGAEHQEQAHRARIAAKRLRYALEPLAALDVPGGAAPLRRLRRLQDTLGEMRDAHLLGERLRARIGRATAPDAAGLREIARLADGDVERHYAHVERAWLGDGAAGFFAQLDALARWLTTRAGTTPPRTFLLSALPEAAQAAGASDIAAGWLPGEHILEALTRTHDAAGTRWVRSLRAALGPHRLELEEELTPELGEALWPLTEGRRLSKRRFRVPDGNAAWEIDEYPGRGVVLARAPHELPAELLPEWIEPFVLREVSGERGFEDATLARQGN